MIGSGYHESIRKFYMASIPLIKEKFLMHQNNVNSVHKLNYSDSQQNLGFIDALRGVAILMVIITHVSPATPNVSGLVSSLCSYGRMGVQLFFVLSAFTLCLTYAGRMGEPNAVSKFYIRRYFRIAPMYYLGILFYSSLVFFDRGFENFEYAKVVWHLLLLHGLNMEAFNDVVPGGWSIGVEFLFYLIFPFIFNLIHGSCRAISVTLIVSIFLSLALYSYLVFFTETVVHAYSLGYWNFVNQSPVFIVGFLLYFNFFYKKKNHDTFFLCLIFFCATVVSLLLYFFKPLFYTVFIPVSSAVSFYGLACLFSRYSFLAHRVLREVGKVSFSMYLIHFFIIDIFVGMGFSFFVPDVQLLFNYFVVTLVTYLIARMTYTYVEVVGIAMAKKIASRF